MSGWGQVTNLKKSGSEAERTLRKEDTLKIADKEDCTGIQDNQICAASKRQSKYILSRAVARSENPGGLVILCGENVPPLVEIGLTDLPKTGGGLEPPQPPPLRQTCIVSMKS